jgi:hypothetical protein
MAKSIIPDKVGGKLRQRRLITANELDSLYLELTERVIDLYDPDEHLALSWQAIFTSVRSLDRI